jgi:5-methylcytosine-specific restriction endonuclease McrA
MKKRKNQRSYRDELVKKQRFKCFYCGLRFGDCPERRATLEHVIRLVDGGYDKRSNMVAACHKCNQERNREAWSKVAKERVA